MTPDRDDPIIDAMLEEALGGVTPPDLSFRILQEAQRRARLAEPAEAIDAPPVEAAPAWETAAEPTRVQPLVSRPDPMAPVPPAVQPVVVRRRPVKYRNLLDEKYRYWIAAAACCLLLGVSLVAYLAYHLGRGPELADQSGDWRPWTASPHDSRDAVVALPERQVVGTVNQAVEARWIEAGVRPSPPAAPATWARRAHVRLVGRIPRLEELQQFTASPNAIGPDRAAKLPLSDPRIEAVIPIARRDALLEQLLESDLFAEEHARTWTTFWTNVLIGRTGGLDPEGVVHREGIEQYLREALLANRPFDQVAIELIAAQGVAAPGHEDFHGAVNFVLSGLESGKPLAAAKTGRIFLGRHLACAQCHDHPLDTELTQERFWQMTAFFSQAEMLREGPLVRLINRDAQNPDGGTAEVGIAFRGKDGQTRTALPVFLNGQAIPPTGRVVQVDRRAALARMIVASDDFSRAIVNRTWAHIMGRGFTTPVDDLGPHNPPSHPELLNYLADQFRAHGYDYRALVRWITLSDLYGLSSEVLDENRIDDPAAGSAPLFSHYYARPMQPEEVYESLVLLGRSAGPEDGVQAAAARSAWLERFTIDLMTDDGGELSLFDNAYAQKLEMVAGELAVRAADPQNTEGVLYRILHSDLTPGQKLDHLFLASLARTPTDEERDAVAAMLVARPGDELAALADIWWALLNSSEFLMDH